MTQESAEVLRWISALQTHENNPNIFNPDSNATL